MTRRCTMHFFNRQDQCWEPTVELKGPLVSWRGLSGTRLTAALLGKRRTIRLFAHAVQEYPAHQGHARLTRVPLLYRPRECPDLPRPSSNLILYRHLLLVPALCPMCRADILRYIPAQMDQWLVHLQSTAGHLSLRQTSIFMDQNTLETSTSMENESLREREGKRRRREEDGIKIIQSEDITLISEIGSGPGYFLHVGRNEGRVIIVRVFNRNPTVRQQLESTVALSKGLMHPNILRIEGISSPTSLMHFIAYENVHWKEAEGPLAAALKNDLIRSITLGFKLIAGLSAGMNHLCVQGVSVGSMGVTNFDIFLDLDDRFVIGVNSGHSLKVEDTAISQESQEDKSWNVLNALCHNVCQVAN
ncbi:hypothetical protein B0H19DRAFT_109104 [Mycena capillaripes]|nr:hypothetical protein B0H19DRAFT_109104 [Mycena capillaripes]